MSIRKEYRPKPSEFYSSNDIIRAHNGHFFDADTLRFFRSRILSQVFAGESEVYFVTSEQFRGTGYSSPRAFTVRAYNPETDSIRTVPPFNQLTRGKALRIARDLALLVAQR